MHAQQIGLGHPRGLAQIVVQPGLGQSRGHRRQSSRPLGVPLSRVVIEHVRVGEDRDGHAANIAAPGSAKNVRLSNPVRRAPAYPVTHSLGGAAAKDDPELDQALGRASDGGSSTHSRIGSQ